MIRRPRPGHHPASGLFQFIDQTWLATLKRHGARYGYARYAALIDQTADGRYIAQDGARSAVMALSSRPPRRLPDGGAGEMAADHAAWLRTRLGRSATAGELYAAHFLGREGAAQLCELAVLTPGADAALTFPAAARANPTLFQHDGRAVSLAELYTELTATPAAYGHRAQTPPADPFLRYAAARQAERLGVHHALYNAALTRTRRRPAAGNFEPVGPAAAVVSAAVDVTLAPSDGEVGGWIKPPM